MKQTYLYLWYSIAVSSIGQAMILKVMYEADLSVSVVQYHSELDRTSYDTKGNVWRVWRYQREVIKIRKSKDRQHNAQKKKYKQRSTKHTHKTKDRVTWIPLKTGGELMCSRRVSRSCSTSGTRRVNLVTNPVISHERGKDREVFTTNGTYIGGHLWRHTDQYFPVSESLC